MNRIKKWQQKRFQNGIEKHFNVKKIPEQKPKKLKRDLKSYQYGMKRQYNEIPSGISILTMSVAFIMLVLADAYFQFAMKLLILMITIALYVYFDLYIKVNKKNIKINFIKDDFDSIRYNYQLIH